MLAFVRFLFAFSIGSHILLVSTSIVLIITISIAEFLSIRRGDEAYETLARRLTKMFVVSFGVGTASGIVMAVELVALFPTFMTLAAQTGVIVLFYAEIFAFFLEVLALVLYVYYWNSFRSRYVHWGVSIFVVLGTVLSAVFITMVNAWMNTPNGFDIATFINSGFMTVSGVQPWVGFLTSSTVSEVFHACARYGGGIACKQASTESKELAGMHEEVFDDGAHRERRQEGEGADQQHRADEQRHEGESLALEGARA